MSLREPRNVETPHRCIFPIIGHLMTSRRVTAYEWIDQVSSSLLQSAGIGYRMNVSGAPSVGQVLKFVVGLNWLHFGSRFLTIVGYPCRKAEANGDGRDLNMKLFRCNFRSLERNLKLSYLLIKTQGPLSSFEGADIPRNLASGSIRRTVH